MTKIWHNGQQFDDEDFRRAVEAGRLHRVSRLHAVSANYLDECDAVEIVLEGGLALTYLRSDIEAFAGVAPEMMRGLTVSPRGSGLEIDDADLHVDVHGLLVSLMSPADLAEALAWPRREAN